MTKKEEEEESWDKISLPFLTLACSMGKKENLLCFASSSVEL
jgi:hypothetical protein